jgi:hypothetical protein
VVAGSLPTTLTVAKPDPWWVDARRAARKDPAAVGRIEGVEDWQRARLIPVAGIRGQEEPEARQVRVPRRALRGAGVRARAPRGTRRTSLAKSRHTRRSKRCTLKSSRIN